MTNILNWPDYKVLHVSELEHDYGVLGIFRPKRTKHG